MSETPKTVSIRLGLPFNQTDDTPEGYRYPPPSIDGGNAPAEPALPPKPLSEDLIRRIRDLVEDQQHTHERLRKRAAV